jgi:CDP-diacylglycerol---glycerol-3-phosphate 3-phosphatidyltransferase
MKKYLPNFLTLTRFLIVPIFLYFAIFCKTESAVIYASLLFIVASLTDYFDGKLARKFNVVSNFGKIMDPLADKVLVITALIALSVNYELIPGWLVYLILTREILVSAFREYFVHRKIYITANIWGKIKTFLQMTGIIIALAYESIIYLYQITETSSIIDDLFLIFFLIVAVITWISGLKYFFLILRLRRK